jgi:hypothetical protein
MRVKSNDICVNNSSNALSQASVDDPSADGLLVKNLAMQSLWYLASAACKSLTAEFALASLDIVFPSFLRGRFTVHRTSNCEEN